MNNSVDTAANIEVANAPVESTDVPRSQALRHKCKALCKHIYVAIQNILHSATVRKAMNWVRGITRSWGKGTLLILFLFICSLLFLFPKAEQCAHNCLTIHVNSTGLKEILSLTGLIGFPFSYIISSKAKKFRGFAFDDIVRHHFPLYGVVFVIQALAVLLGLYSFYIRKITTLGLCTIVALLCLTYTTKMALCLVFSEKRKTKLAKKYLQFHLENKKGQNTHVVMDYCRYLSEKYKDTFLAASIALHYDAHDFALDSKSEIARFYHDILPVLELGNDKPKKNRAGICRHGDTCCPSAVIASGDANTKDFKDFFDVCSRHMKYDQTQDLELIRKHPVECAILFEVPQFDARMNIIKNEMLPLIEMWEGLLGDEKDLKKQAAIIFAVMNHCIRTQIFAGRIRFVEISLLVCIARHTIQNGTDGWKQLQLLFYYCDTITTQTFKAVRIGEKHKEKKKEEEQKGGMGEERTEEQTERAFRDLFITALAFSILSQVSTNDLIPVESIGRILGLHARPYRENYNEESALQYLCYAKVAFDQIWIPEQTKPTPAELYLVLPLIVRALLQEVNKEKYEKELCGI